MPKRKVEILKTRVAGKVDDTLWGVTTYKAEGAGARAYQKQPCPGCPFVKENTGNFPPEAFCHSASTAYDGAFNTFACHETGTEAPAMCAGFLLVNSENNTSVRIAQRTGALDLSRVKPDGRELWESYRAMAIGNGVDPADPRIQPCRADDEEWQNHHRYIPDELSPKVQRLLMQAHEQEDQAQEESQAIDTGSPASCPGTASGSQEAGHPDQYSPATARTGGLHHEVGGGDPEPDGEPG